MGRTEVPNPFPGLKQGWFFTTWGWWDLCSPYLSQKVNSNCKGSSFLILVAFLISFVTAPFACQCTRINIPTIWATLYPPRQKQPFGRQNIWTENMGNASLELCSSQNNYKWMVKFNWVWYIWKQPFQMEKTPKQLLNVRIIQEDAAVGEGLSKRRHWNSFSHVGKKSVLRVFSRKWFSNVLKQQYGSCSKSLIISKFHHFEGWRSILTYMSVSKHSDYFLTLYM